MMNKELLNGPRSKKAKFEVGPVQSTIQRSSFSTQHSLRIFKTSWGWMGMAATPRGVRAIVLPRSSRQAAERELRRRVMPLNGARPSNGKPLHRRGPSQGRNGAVEKLLQDAHQQVLEFLEGGHRTLAVPLDLSGGSSFQRKVWNAILRIPYSRVRSYKWVAARVGGTRYARAVGLALGANPVPLVVPCHRVVAHDGSLGGFTGGLRMKRRLLLLEGTLPQLCRKA